LPQSRGGAARGIEVIAPGGTQRVRWRDDGIYLTGWAEVVFDGVIPSNAISSNPRHLGTPGTPGALGTQGKPFLITCQPLRIAKFAIEW
jgi:hypothetical protein